MPMFMSSHATFRQDVFPASPFQTPLKEPVFPDEDEYEEPRSRSRLAVIPAFERDSEISWVAELGEYHIYVLCSYHLTLIPSDGTSSSRRG